MTRPNFFIVGAPKCGTTAMYTYLRGHPDVFMPTRKEPKFFAPDLDSGSQRDGEVFVRNIEDYLGLFSPGVGATRLGEASAVYLYSTSAARNIHAFDPAARIIVMLRNPVDVMYAFHAERLYNGNEDIVDFAEALQAEGARRAGRRLPRNGSIPAALQYRAVVRFSEQLERYIDCFGIGGVKIVFFEDFAADPSASFMEVLEFLGLPPVALPTYDVVNPSKRLRNSTLARIVRRPPAVLKAARDLLPESVRGMAARRIINWNTERGNRKPMEPRLRAQLTEELSEDILRLERLTGRSLQHWLNA